MDAQTAREITQKYLHEQLKEVIDVIYKAAMRGSYEVEIDIRLNPTQRDYLESLGYTVKFKQVGVDGHKISW
jgi:hypothetical protein